MARKHHRPQVHHGTPRRGTLCGLPPPRFGAGLTQRRENITCLSCLNVLATTSPPEGIDRHAADCRFAVRDRRLALGA